MGLGLVGVLGCFRWGIVGICVSGRGWVVVGDGNETKIFSNIHFFHIRMFYNFVISVHISLSVSRKGSSSVFDL